MGRAGHAQIGDKAQPFGKDLAVGGGHMGVGPPEGLGHPVQMPGQGALFAGGLGVEVHQDHVGLRALQNPPGGGKGVVGVAVQLTPADEVEHPDPQPPGPLVHAPAAAGHGRGKIGGAEDVGIFVQVTGDLEPVPGVIAQRDHIGPGGEDVVGLPGEDAHPGGVFPVDHGKVDVVLPPELPQAAGEQVQTGLPHHVAHRQNT